MGVYSTMELEPYQAPNTKSIQMDQRLKFQGWGQGKEGLKFMTFDLSVTTKRRTGRLDFMKM